MHSKNIRNTQNIYIVVAILAFIILLPSYNTGFIGDDCLRILEAKDSVQLTDAYGYFRPFVGLTFKFLWMLFDDLSVLYHIFITIVYISCIIVIYNFILILDYDKFTALLSAVFFTVIACHSEVIYSISSLNEMFSCLFLILGLFYYVKSHKIVFKFSAMLFFTLALFSRESALCYIPLVFVISMKLRLRINLRSVYVLTAPLLIYISSWYLLTTQYSSRILVTPGTLNRLNLDIFTITYKIIYLFANTSVPFKIINKLLVEDIRQSLISVFINPGINIPLFILELVIVGFLTFLFVLFIRRNKEIRGDFLFAFMFAISAYFVYLFVGGVSERFLFTPSVGVVLLIAVISRVLCKSGKKITSVVITLFIIVHMASQFYRCYIYKRAFYDGSFLLNNLYEQTKSLPPNSNILLEKFPAPLKEIDAISLENFKSVWNYYYPDASYNFYFGSYEEQIEKINAILEYDRDKLEFKKKSDEKQN